MSLVEVMTVAAILGVLTLGGLSLNNYLTKVSSYSEHRTSLLSLERMIGQRLNDPVVCQATLGSASGLSNHVSAQPSEISLNIPNIQAGPTQGSNVIAAGIDIQPLKLHLTSLQLRDTTQVTGQEYQTNLYLDATDAAGFTFKTDLVSAVILTLPSGLGGTIAACHANSLQDSQQVCTDMGCVWSATATPNCQCPTAVLLPCPAPQQYPVSYDSGGHPTCLPLGDNANCPAHQYLTGLQLGHKTCATLGTPTPSPTPSPTPGICPTSWTCPANQTAVSFFNMFSFVGFWDCACAPTPVCGSDNGVASATTPAAANLCSVGNSPMAATQSGSNWNWTCVSSIGGGYPPATVNCAAPTTPVGACGGANLHSYASAVAANSAGLCSAGTASPASLSGSGPWSWTCTAAGGSASCSATASTAMSCAQIQGGGSSGGGFSDCKCWTGPVSCLTYPGTTATYSLTCPITYTLNSCSPLANPLTWAVPSLTTCSGAGTGYTGTGAANLRFNFWTCQ